MNKSISISPKEIKLLKLKKIFNKYQSFEICPRDVIIPRPNLYDYVIIPQFLIYKQQHMNGHFVLCLLDNYNFGMVNTIQLHLMANKISIIEFKELLIHAQMEIKLLCL